MKGLRRPRPADAGPVADLYNAYDRAHGVESSETAEEIAAWWRELDLEQDAWIVEQEGAGISAFGCAEAPRDACASVDACARAGLPDAVGLLGSLFALAEARAAARGAARVETTVFADDSDGTGALEARGYVAVRHYVRMGIELGGEPEPPSWPAGLAPTPFVPERDAAAFHAALEDAFVDEWAYRSEPFERWRERQLASPLFDPTLWLAVREGDTIAATLVCESRRFGVPWIVQLGVRRPWRRRGLGLAMLRHAFGEFWRRGERQVGLGVDVASPTGATVLYERAGMRPAARWTFFARDVGPGRGG